MTSTPIGMSGSPGSPGSPDGPERPTGIVLGDDRSSVRLLFRPDPNPRDGVTTAWRPATLTMGEGGRIVAVDIAGDPAGEGSPVEVDVAPWVGTAVREVAIRAEVTRRSDGALVAVAIPRRGAGYEITYPSGNQ